jgi:hypothetical protein
VPQRVSKSNGRAQTACRSPPENGRGIVCGTGLYRSACDPDAWPTPAAAIGRANAVGDCRSCGSILVGFQLGAVAKGQNANSRAGRVDNDERAQLEFVLVSPKGIDQRRRHRLRHDIA